MLIMAENRVEFLMGDTHGYTHLPELLTNYEDCNIYHVGDFGLGFVDSKREVANLKVLETYLSLKGIKLYVIRGNHDNPLLWRQQLIDSPYIKFVPDYSVIGDKLFIGGAISIDRMYRIIQKAGWWEDEIFVYKDCSELTGIKHVITHSSPHFCFPVKFNQLVYDFIALEKELGQTSLQTMLLEERQLITNVYRDLIKNNSLKTWNYGHFHKDNTEVMSGIKFRCIGINKIIRL